MSDETPSKRPNAKYKLSPDKRNEAAAGSFRGEGSGSVNTQDIPFYYSRGRRLEKAPEAVRSLYYDNKPVRFGLFHSLIADRPRRFLFAMIILLCVAILLLSIFGYFDTSYLLDGNKIDAAAASYEGSSIIIINKTVRNKNAYSGNVDIGVSPAVGEEDAYSIFTHRVFFSAEKEEVFRFAVPYDNPELLIVLQNEKNIVQIKINPK